MKIRIYLIPLACVLVSGCMTVGPDYEAPETKVPDAWNQAVVENFTGDQPALQTWWEVFGDPTLNTLVQRVAEGNLDLKIAASRMVEARTRLASSRGEYYPEVDAVGAAQWTRASEETTPVLPSGLHRKDNLFQAGLNVGWELDLWGRIRRSVESADAAYQGSVENYRDTLVLLYAEVAATYADLRSLQARIRYAENNVDLQKKTLKLTKDRNSAGLVPDLDVRQAELNLATTSAAIPVLRTMLIESKYRLGTLSGQAPGALSDLLEGVSDIPVPPKDVSVGLPADLLRQRPDVRRAERELASQHARIGVAEGSLYPTFSLPGTFVLEAPSAGDVFSGDSLTYGFGPSLRWNLFAGGRIRNAIRIEEARTEQALLFYENTVLLALEDVETAMVAVAEEHKRLDAVNDAVQAAEASADLVDTLYRAGLTDFQNVLDMQRALSLQQDTLAASEGDLSKNYVRLYKALGGGWNIAETTPQEPVTAE